MKWKDESFKSGLLGFENYSGASEPAIPGLQTSSDEVPVGHSSSAGAPVEHSSEFVILAIHSSGFWGIAFGAHISSKPAGHSSWAPVLVAGL